MSSPAFDRLSRRKDSESSPVPGYRFSLGTSTRPGDVSNVPRRVDWNAINHQGSGKNSKGNRDAFPIDEPNSS